MNAELGGKVHRLNVRSEPSPFWCEGIYWAQLATLSRYNDQFIPSDPEPVTHGEQLAPPSGNDAHPLLQLRARALLLPGL